MRLVFLVIIWHADLSVPMCLQGPRRLEHCRPFGARVVWPRPAADPVRTFSSSHVNFACPSCKHSPCCASAHYQSLCAGLGPPLVMLEQ